MLTPLPQGELLPSVYVPDEAATLLEGDSLLGVLGLSFLEESCLEQGASQCYCLPLASATSDVVIAIES